MKTKEEVISYIESSNWGKRWIDAITNYSLYEFRNNNSTLSNHIGWMFNRYSRFVHNYIKCGAVSLHSTREGRDYWMKIGEHFTIWFNS